MHKSMITATFLMGMLMLSDRGFAFDNKSMVKRTDSDICHPPESPYYDRIKTFDPVTLEDCLKDGGRLPASLQKAYDAKQVANDPSSSSEAKAFAMKAEADALADNKTEKKNVQEFAGLRFGLGIEKWTPKIGQCYKVESGRIKRIPEDGQTT